MLPLSRILIVDDNADHRLILTYQLARIGPFEIHETGDGQQALVVIATTPPDLIFMNLGLPLLDGWECIRRIRVLANACGELLRHRHLFRQLHTPHCGALSWAGCCGGAIAVR